MQTSENMNYYQGTTTGSGYWTQPRGNVCPGCGRCRDCGRPYETQPANPHYPWGPIIWQGTNAVTASGGIGMGDVNVQMNSQS